MDTNTVQNLDIAITYFDTLEQMLKEWKLANYKFINELYNYKGIAWQETLDHHYVMFPCVMNTIEELLKNKNRT